VDDEIALIEYITDHKAQAGNGMKFKPLFWTGAAKAMLAHTALGGPKTAPRCSAKWDRVHTNPSHVIYYQLTCPHQLKKLYNVIATIKKNMSGFTWDDEKGLKITINEACTWDEYVVVGTIKTLLLSDFTKLLLEQ
jgi:hypothetical protein